MNPAGSEYSPRKPLLPHQSPNFLIVPPRDDRSDYSCMTRQRRASISAPTITETPTTPSSNTNNHNDNMLHVPLRSSRSTSVHLDHKKRASLSKQLSNLETSRKTSFSHHHAGIDGEWTQAVHNLNNALSVVRPAQRKDSLRILLDEVDKNENVTAKDLIDKIQHPPTSPLPTTTKRGSLTDWAPLKAFRKLNKPEYLRILPVVSENGRLSERSPPQSPRSPRLIIPRITVVDTATSPLVFAPDERPPLHRAAGHSKLAPPRFGSIDEEEVEDDVFCPEAKSGLRRSVSADHHEFQDAREDEEEDVTRVLNNVAVELEHSDGTFDRFIQVLQHEQIQDNFNGLIDYALAKLQDQWETILDILVPIEKIQTMLFVCLIQTFSVQQLVKSLPILATYVSFWIMIYTTLNLFHMNYWTKETEKWRKLLHVFLEPSGNHSIHDCNLEESTTDKDEMELENTTDGENNAQMESRRLLRTYGKFFMGLVVLISSTSMRVGHPPNASSLSLLSLLFGAASCILLTTRQEKALTAGILGVTMTALAPKILIKLGLLDASGLIYRRFFHFNIGGTFKLTISFPTILIIGTLPIYVVVLWKWKQSKKTGMDLLTELVLPHALCLAWWRMAVELFAIGDDGIEWRNIALTLAMIWLAFSTTTLSIAFFLVTLFAQLKSMIKLITLIKILITLSVLFLPFLYEKMLRHLSNLQLLPGFLTSGGNGRPKTTAILMYALLISGSIYFLYQGNLSGHHQSSMLDLTWREFEMECGEAYMNKLSNTSSIVDEFLEAQAACNEYRGAIVRWEGRIRRIEITNIDNFYATFFSYLPNGIAQRLRCFCGDPSVVRKNSTRSAEGRCSLAASNVYTFKIDVTLVPEGFSEISANATEANSTNQPIVSLFATHGFKDQIGTLSIRDTVRFAASFQEDVGLKYPTKMTLRGLQCTNCGNGTEGTGSNQRMHNGGESWSSLNIAGKALFNFVFSPLLTVE